ncbi:MAG: LPS export ABC transporter periplasmic protein LptC [Cyclobacteriaceae bacterium]
MKEDQKVTNRIKKLTKTVMELVHDRFLVLILMGLLAMSCEDRKDLLEAEIYEGPIMEMEDINVLLTDSAKMVMRLIAERQLTYESGDKEWPKGMLLQYYGAFDTPQVTFQSNITKYIASENHYQGIGNVMVKNLQNGDELATEELFWDPSKEQFYTDKFVTIISDGEIHKGEGLIANQEFTSYQIKNPSGTINIEEEN